MLYTPAEKREMDAILAAFSDFIHQSAFFDILYSEKIGYFRLTCPLGISYEVVQIENAKALLRLLVDEVVREITFSQNPCYLNQTISTAQEAHARQTLSDILQTLSCDPLPYLEYAQEYLHTYKNPTRRD